MSVAGAERLARIQAIDLRVRTLVLEARRCSDLERLRAIGDEIEVLHAAMVEIREEQIAENFETARRTDAERRSRWRRWLGLGAAA